MKKASLRKLNEVASCVNANKIFSGKLSELFTKYVRTGGFLLPIIEFFNKGRVTLNTLKTYLN